jgi:hypothetical protein
MLRKPLLVLERFADPSRRCDAARGDFVSGDVERIDLPNLRRAPLGFVRALPGALYDWVTLPVSLRERASLALAAACTGGARLGALVLAARLLRRAQAGDVSAIACYSAKDFPLAQLLARATGSPCCELLAHGTRYFGEFAFELLAVIPYAYWLHQQGRLQFTESTPDTRCLYWFSPEHRELRRNRSYVPITEYPVGVPGWLRYDRNAFPEFLDRSRWLPPPYRDVYRDNRFRFARPMCVVCNKATSEYYKWHRSMTNHLPSDLLLDLVGRLRTRYQVVYNRPRAADMVNDHQAVRELGDIEAVKQAYPDICTIQELHARHPELGYNELQLRLYANCDRFVSVLGGSSYLASWFGGVNVIFAKRGWEVACGAYQRWFHRFSGARVVATTSHEELRAAVERELL